MRGGKKNNQEIYDRTIPLHGVSHVNLIYIFTLVYL